MPDATWFTISPAPIDHAPGACGVEYVHPLLDWGPRWSSSWRDREAR